MSAVLSEAETKFFSSRGQDVDASLSASDTPDTPLPETKETPPAVTPAAATPPPKAAETPPPAAEPPKQPDTKGHVPIEALHAERRQRQQMEQEFRTLQQQFQQMQEFLRQAAQPQEERPDPNQDPYGALEYDNRQMRAQLEQFGQWRDQQTQTQQQQSQLQRLTQHLTSAEQQFATTQKDYFQAADFAIKHENTRLQAFYPDPAQRAQILRQEIANVVAQAAQQGINPAQIIYQHAKNLGYTGPAPAIPPGGTPAPATPVPPAPPVSEVVQKIEKGLKQQSNLSAGGSTPPSEMTPEMLAAISDPDEFNKQWDKAFKKRR